MKTLWKLDRDVRAMEIRIGRKLDAMIAFDEWYRRSKPFLDPAKTREQYLATFLAGLSKVRVPTGSGGNTLNEALEAAKKLTLSELPVVSGFLDAPESFRRITALHSEMSRRSATGTYFLSYRDAAKACTGLTYQEAYNITFALERYDVIKIVSRGKPGLNSSKSAEFRYLLPLTEKPSSTIDELPEIDL